jgi:hypothetical protein
MLFDGADVLPHFVNDAAIFVGAILVDVKSENALRSALPPVITSLQQIRKTPRGSRRCLKRCRTKPAKTKSARAQLLTG